MRGVLHSLDGGESVCEVCERTTYANWDHHNKGAQLKAMWKKLDAMAAQFEGKTEGGTE